ncbi:MAG: N-acetylmuramoyl-L-alanine amidase [Clostridia bacterium]|nr:N-acetylmuramoyl-L-alanine amidase [Clostridia bacterium]
MKRHHLQLCALCALFLTVTLLCSALFGVTSDLLSNATDADAEAAESSPVIVLDVGHGGEDGGATGTNGILEKELNLRLTEDLAALLRLAGYTVVETRTEDRLLYSEGTKKGHKKQSDLENRLAVAAQYESCILISIHMNTFPDQRCRGTQVWYSQNHPESRALAEAVQSTVKKLLQPENNRKIKAATSSIYMLRHAKAPAILVECGFLSTPSDCERLCDTVYQRELTLSLLAAICEKVPLSS